MCIAKALFSKNHQVFGDVMDRVRQKIDKRIGQWDQFVKKVYGDEKEAYHELACIIKNRKEAIDAAHEKDVSIAMLLAAVTHLKGEVNVLKRIWDEEHRLKSRSSTKTIIIDPWGRELWKS